MAHLPKERVMPDKSPFTGVGIDNFGPMEIKRKKPSKKVWGVFNLSDQPRSTPGTGTLP